MYSIGSNAVWNSSSSWSFSANGPVAGFIPQGNDTLVITGSVIQNVNFAFSGHGLMEVSSLGLLRGDNLNLDFSGNSSLLCDGEIKTNNLSFTDNAAFVAEDNGKITVNNSFSNSSANKHSISGRLIVRGTLFIGQYVVVSGRGVVESAHYEGDGSVMSIVPASSIPDGSLITENNWLGTVNANWNEPMNWSAGVYPNGNLNISVVSSLYNPEISDIADCDNLYINSGSMLTVYPSATLNVAGRLSVIGLGKLLLKSTATEKASLLLHGSVTGKVQSEYQVLAGQKNLLSSPVDIALSATFLNMYLRPYNEAGSQWGEYIVPTNNPLQVMQGYELYSLSSDTRVFEGTPNHSAQSFNISNSGNGLNLTGNPFPCYIDWENTDKGAWQRSATAAAIYYPDPSGSGNFSVYLPGGDDAVSINNGSRYIAPMQGFFVKASGKQGVLTVNESSRVNNFSDARILAKNNSLKLKLTDSDGLTDEALFRVNTSSTAGFDDNMDAIKFPNSTNSPSLYLESDDDTKYSVSSIPSLNSSLIVPLTVVCSKSGMFSLSVTGCTGFDGGYPVTLLDKELNVYIDPKADSVYSFYHTPEMQAKRFEFHFNSAQGIGEQDNSIAMVSVCAGEVRIAGAENDIYTAKLFSIEGKLVSMTKGVLSEGLTLTSGNCKNAICMVQVSNGKRSMVRKIMTK